MALGLVVVDLGTGGEVATEAHRYSARDELYQTRRNKRSVISHELIDGPGLGGKFSLSSAFFPPDAIQPSHPTYRQHRHI